MQITDLKKDSISYHAKVVISNDNIQKIVDEELSKLSKTAKMPGFRVGKVPFSMISKKYRPSIQADVIKKEMNSSVGQVVEEKSLNTVDAPAVKDVVMEEGKDLEFTLEFELVPTIEMPDFAKISLEKPIVKIDNKEVEKQIKDIAEDFKSYDKENKGKAKKGDQLTIDAIGYVDEKAFDGGKLDGHKLVLGSGAFIPGFEDQLIGSKSGDDVTVNVDFPKEYHVKELAGKPSKFEVKVKSIHSPSPVEINDEFAQKLQCKNLDELKEKLLEQLGKSYDYSIHLNMKMKLFDQLDEVLDFDVPNSLVDRELKILKSQADKSDEIYDELEDKSDKGKEEYIKKLALRRVRVGLFLAEYVKTKSIVVEQEDIRNMVMDQARKYPGQEAQIIEFYNKNKNARESLEGQIVEEKAVKEIFDKEIKIKEKKYSKKELEELLK